MSAPAALRAEVLETARRMNALGINQGSSGNVSARHGDGLVITPSGADYDLIGPDDMVEMDGEGKWTCAVAGRRPSSEWRFHSDILAARPEFGAVVHTHAVNATALACMGRSIPAFHYMVAVAGGDSIRLAAYATFGSQALSDSVLIALEGRKACLMSHHGMIACGRDLRGALNLAVEVETLAAQYWRCLQLGEPKLLNRKEMQRVLEKMGQGPGYGSAG